MATVQVVGGMSGRLDVSRLALRPNHVTQDLVNVSKCGHSAESAEMKG